MVDSKGMPFLASIQEASCSEVIANAGNLSTKDATLPSNHEFPITVKHTFGLKAKSFACKEVLYVSDSKHESHYRKGHAMNKGKIAIFVSKNMF